MGHTPVRVHLSLPPGGKMYRDDETNLDSPFIPHEEHWVPRARGGKGSSFVCGRAQCVICAYSNPQAFGFDMEPDVGLAKCWPKQRYGVAGWVEEWHHNVQYQMDNGEGVFHAREPHNGKNCEFCDWPKVFGRRFYMPFSAATWHNHIERVHDLASRSCKCGGTVYTTHYTCPKCGNMTEDVLNACVCGSEDLDINLEQGEVGCRICGRNWPAYPSGDEELMKRVENPTNCPHCKEKDIFQVPVIACTTEGCAGDPYSVFDCQLILKKEGEGKQTKVIVEDWKIQEPDPRLFDPKLQGDDEWANAHRDTLNAPLDVSRYFRPDEPAFVAQQIGVVNPFVGQTMSRQVLHYPRSNRVADDNDATEGYETQTEDEQ